MRLTMRELLAVIRLAGCQLSRRQYEADLQRAREGYAKAIDAERAARVDLAMLDHHREQKPTIPEYLKLRALRPNN